MSKQKSKRKRRKARKQPKNVKARSPMPPPGRIFGGSKAEARRKACRKTDPRKEGQ